MIPTLHKLFHKGVDAENAGVYRNVQVIITGSGHIPPSAEEIPSLMGRFADDLNERWNNIHTVTLAAYAHRKLVDIHPARFGENPSDEAFNALMAECQIESQKEFFRMFHIKPR